MHIYLPIAEMPANVLLFLGMGAAVGFLSGLFGVGGGFLLTPLLIFSGIPTPVAVGTAAAQIVASSVSGAIAQYRRNNVDIKMGLVLLAGGVVGSVIGVQMVRILRLAGQFDLFVALAYVTFLGAIGTLMMIERKDVRPPRDGGLGWLAYAVLAALFAALTAILGKVGIDGVESSLGTAIRTCVVLAASWGIVAWKGKLGLVRGIERRELAFLALSGLATGASWLCYYYALQTGVVSVVVQVDKLSIVASIAFAWLVLGERLSRKASLGLLLIVVGTVAMTAFA